METNLKMSKTKSFSVYKMSKTMVLCTKLEIAINHVEISTNVDVENGLSNGSCGQVMAVTTCLIHFQELQYGCVLILRK